MPNDKKDRRPNDATSPGLSRRNFIAFAAGLTAAATGTASDREQRVIDMDTDVKTPDGICDAVFIHPARGSHPGVLLWHDSPGLRPVIRDLGKRIAAEGYSVLVPNLFYRAHRAPVFDASFDYANNPADRENYARTVASFHGGFLATDKPNSPHLLAPKIKARLYFAIAADDDKREPEVKNKLREAFAAAKVRAEIEVYPNALHGWCVPDSRAAENKQDAEHAWGKLVALYKHAL